MLILLLLAGTIAVVAAYLTLGLWPAVAIAAGFTILVIYFATRKTPDHTPVAVSSEADTIAVNKLEQAIESLLPLNLDIRLQSMPTEVRGGFEKTIDALLLVLPKVEHSAPDGELAWVVYRIAEDYLPKRIIQPYQALATDLRAQPATVADVLANLDAMYSELMDVDRLISARTVDEYSAKSTFLKHRFNIEK